MECTNIRVSYYTLSESLQHFLVCSLNVQDVATVLAVVLGPNPQKVNLG